MMLKTPKNTERFEWTIHSASKMKQYGLSESRVKRVINNPRRKEVGIAPGTVAVMQPNSSKHAYEFLGNVQNPKRREDKNYYCLEISGQKSNSRPDSNPARDFGRIG